MKIVKKVKVLNDLGLHVRPATVIVKLLQNRHSKVFFKYKDMRVNARSVMSILALAVKKYSTIVVFVEGRDAEITMKEIVEAFKKRFGEY